MDSEDLEALDEAGLTRLKLQEEVRLLMTQRQGILAEIEDRVARRAAEQQRRAEEQQRHQDMMLREERRQWQRWVLGLGAVIIALLGYIARLQGLI